MAVTARLHAPAIPSAPVTPDDAGSLLPISDDSSNDPITGMWHVTFTAMGNEVGPPDNTPIDNALVVFHSDGTEIMNSARPAQDGNFCLGIWKKVDKSRYKVNHIPWFSNDTTNAPSGGGTTTQHYSIDAPKGGHTTLSYP